MNTSNFQRSNNLIFRFDKLICLIQMTIFVLKKNHDITKIEKYSKFSIYCRFENWSFVWKIFEKCRIKIYWNFWNIYKKNFQWNQRTNNVKILIQHWLIKCLKHDFFFMRSKFSIDAIFDFYSRYFFHYRFQKHSFIWRFSIFTFFFSFFNINFLVN